MSDAGLKFERLSHAYIAGGGVADVIAAAAVCSGSGARPCMACAHCGKASRGVHPDVFTLEKLPDKREIVVDQIRELKKDVIVIPCEARKKAYIISDADLMNTSAQNAFLQVLEEPPSHAVFILKTDNPAQLLPTVRSRCVELKAAGGSDAVIADGAKQGCADIVDGFYSAIDSGSLALTKFMFRLEKLEKDAFTEFLTIARDQSSVRLKALACEIGMPEPEKNKRCMKLSRCEELLVRAGEMLDLNVNTGHISGMLCAGLL